MKEIKYTFFKGWHIKSLYMPNGDRIVVTFCRDGVQPKESLHNANHGVYRLDKKDNIIWQVTRDDSIMPHDWWEKCHELAREEGADGHRIPFSYIVLEYPDGTKANSDEDGDGTNILM